MGPAHGRRRAGTGGTPTADETTSDLGWRSARGAVNYLRVWPRSLAGAARLCDAYVRTLGSAIVRSQTFGSVGEHLRGVEPVEVRFAGFLAYVRPRSEDLAILTGNHEPGVMDWFEPKHGQFVVDAGAHIGTYTLRAAIRGARVVAFEPNPETYRILIANISLNRLGTVSAHNIALGSARGSARLRLPPVYLGRASISREIEGGSAVEVLVSPLDDELSATEKTRIDWLKVDVEGYEVELLRGAPRVLGRTRRIILEVEHGNESACEALLIHGHGFVRKKRVVQPTQDYWLLEHPSLA